MYIKLFRDLLTSTIWMEEDYVVRVWLTFLLLSNQEGFVECPIPGIAQQARVTLDEAAAAIDRLEKPDPFSRTAKEDGARIVRVTNEKTLWHVVNRESYSAIRSEEQKRAYQREYMKDYRLRKKKELTCEENLQRLAQGEGEGEGDGEEQTHMSVFECEFWDRWPKGRKIDKKKCERKFNRLTKKQQAAATGPGYQAWLDHWVTTDTQFIPHPMTWLNGMRWESDPPVSKRKPSNESIQVAADFAEIADSHKKSCENARNLVDECIHANPVPELIAQLAVLKITTIKAEEMPAGTGYKAIVAQEDFLLDWVSDHYELEAPTTTGRRKLAREKIGLPVLY